ncbi:hypothetical protein HZS_7289 [Henneguya salminicola]|nr:hypothetical protein HZS_7289 [Henneguya salminicola]
MKLAFDEQRRLIIPNGINVEILKDIHEFYRHPGGRCMIGMIKEYLSIDSFRKKCYAIVTSCQKCLENKSYNPHKKTLYGGLYSHKPFEIISTDMVGPCEGYHFLNPIAEKILILTIVDICTRYSLATELEKPDAANICKVLINKWFEKFGKPQTIISDQGRPYIAKTYKDLLRNYQIQASFTSTYNPTGNTISERINSTISATLRLCKGMPFKYAMLKTELRFSPYT